MPTAPEVSTPPPAVAKPPLDPATASIQLSKLLADYTTSWRTEYALRLELAKTCAYTTSYSYGMRMLQPATFKGDFSESVQKRYGLTTDFIVIAVANNSAASRAKIQEGDRITKIGVISSVQPDAGRLLAAQSKRWSKPYEVNLNRTGQDMAVTITPDKLCDVPSTKNTSRPTKFKPN